MNRSMTLAVLVCVLISAPIAFANLLPQIEYEEDFSTTTYLDAANTTAEWDTDQGVIRLPGFDQTFLGGVNPSGYVRDAVPFGPYLLVASGSLAIYDVSDPTNPHSVGVVSTAPAEVQAIAAGNRYAYLACGADGMKVVDLADPLAGSIVGTWDASRDATSIAVAGNLVLLGEPGSLWVIDVSDPTNPVDIGRYTPACHDVVFAGNLAYVASGANGLRIVSLQDPLVPVQIGTTSTGGSAQGVDVAGDLACIAAGEAGLVTVDVSDPTNPVVLGSFATSDAFRVTIEGDFAYVADKVEGGLLFDVRDPLHPVLIDDHPTPGPCYGFVPSGKHAYLCMEAAGFRVVATAEELPEPIVLGSTGLPTNCVDLVVSGNTAVAAVVNGGTLAVDLSDPLAPYSYGYASGFDARNVALAGDFAYAAGSDGLVTVDITDLNNPMSTLTGISASDVATDEHLLYVAAGGVSVYDIKDPANPTLLDNFSHYELEAYALAVQGTRAIVLGAGGVGSKIWMLDVSDPTNIILDFWSLSSFDFMEDIALDGNVVYMAGPSGYVVFEIVAPGAPVARGYDSTYDMDRVTVVGDRLYASGPDGIHVYDLADPLYPTYMSTIDQPAGGLASSGDYLYAGDPDVAEVAVVEVLQRRYDRSANQAQSLPFYAGEHEPHRLYSWAVLQPGSDAVSFDYSKDGGSSWDPVPNLSWEAGTNPSAWTDLRWRAMLDYQGGGVSPTCSQLAFYWWFRYPIIEMVEDVPNDQGRQVRLYWLRSGSDWTDSLHQTQEYQIYRQIDDPDKAAWYEFVTSVPAAIYNDYAVICPTLADSTSEGVHESTFFVRAFHSPSYYAESPLASGYSIDNLAPFPPAGATVGAGLQLSWDPPVDEDFRYVTVYGSESGVLDGTEVIVGYTTGTEFDASVDIHPYYILTATDFSGNEGEAVALSNQISDVPSNVPARTALLGNSPNPFNPATTIAFELSRSGRVVMEIYDLAGRRITVLEDKVFEAGRHEVPWNGRDGDGRSVPTGIYLCRMTAESFEATTRMTLLK